LSVPTIRRRAETVNTKSRFVATVGNGPTHEPDAYEPDAYEPDAYEPDAYEPDAYEPDAYEPDAYEPDAYEPDAEASGDAQTGRDTASPLGSIATRRSRVGLTPE